MKDHRSDRQAGTTSTTMPATQRVCRVMTALCWLWIFPAGAQEFQFDGSMSRRVLENYLSRDRKSTRLNSSHLGISYAVFCLRTKRLSPLSDGMVGALRAQERNLSFAGMHELRDGWVAYGLEPLAAMRREDRLAGVRIDKRLR